MKQLIIDSLDLSNYIFQHVDLKESPTYIDGLNVGKSKVGTAINDRIHTQYETEFPLRPITREVVQSIQAKCNLNQCSATYDCSRGNPTVTEIVQVDLSNYQYAFSVQNGNILEDYYAGAIVTLRTL